MTKHNVQYAVKVLSGVNKGAIADLENASGLVIGRSAGCDIIFNGANVADRHVAVELDKGKIRLTPLAQPVYIDGRDVGSNEVVLLPNQLINIGTVDFTVANKQQSWPNYDAEKKIIVRKSGDGLRDSARGKTYTGSKIQERSSFLNNPWLWVAAVIMLLANVHYLTRQYGGIPGLLSFTETADQKINSIMKVDQYPGLYVQRMDDQLVHIKGYVDTEADKNALKSEVSSFKNKVVLDILVDSEIEDNARMIAQSLNENGITFTTLEHGRLKANGLTESRRRWINVKENIRSDVPGVVSINDDDVKNLREMFLILEKKVATESFSKRLTLELSKGTITAKGRLTKEEKAKWSQLKTDFEASSFYPFRFLELIRSPDAGIKLSIRSVSVGEVPFVVSKEGNKYFKGSHIGSGYYIESINNDHILLNNNNIIFPIYFGQEKE